MKDTSLQTMLPESEGVTIKGELIVPLPFPFGKIPVVARMVSNLMDFASTMPDGLLDSIKMAAVNKDDTQSMAEQLDPNIITFFLGLMEHSIVDVMTLISLSTKKPLTWVEELDAVEGLELTVAVFTVNYDFFTARFSPALSGLLNKMNKLPLPAENQ